MGSGTSPVSMVTIAHNDAIANKLSNNDKKQDECILGLISVMDNHDQNDKVCSTFAPLKYPPPVASKEDRRMR